jgi:hypothetical protein
MALQNHIGSLARQGSALRFGRKRNEGSVLPYVRMILSNKKQKAGTWRLVADLCLTLKQPVLCSEYMMNQHSEKTIRHLQRRYKVLTPRLVPALSHPAENDPASRSADSAIYSLPPKN